MSHEILNIAGPSRLLPSKATCAAPSCGALTPCRGLRPHHARKDRVGTWEISRLTTGHWPPWSASGRLSEPKPMMHGREKSGLAVVTMKPGNKAGKPPAELVEPRAGAEGNASQQSMRRAQNRESVSHALVRIRQAKTASPSNTRGGSRMRESRLYGSVRGALSNGRPYRVGWPCPKFGAKRKWPILA